MKGESIFDRQQVRLAKEAMLPADVVDEVAETFKVLSSGTRVRLIRALSAGELCVNDLSSVLDLSISATSHQLKTLRHLGIVSQRTKGKHTFYALRDSFVSRLLTDCLVNNGALGDLNG
jgi:ArsR family transcriptional regulator, lead/cadmium/zinc/bismuth-responsive transcriptional repressor